MPSVVDQLGIELMEAELAIKSAKMQAANELAPNLKYCVLSGYLGQMPAAPPPLLNFQAKQAFPVAVVREPNIKSTPCQIQSTSFW
jgi:hypothetical protein